MALRSFGPIFAEVEGDPRILALHGWGRRGADFGSALRGLGYVAPDLPGFGASPRACQKRLEPKAMRWRSNPSWSHWPLKQFWWATRSGVALPRFSPPLIPSGSPGVILTGVPLLKRAPSSRAPLLYRLGRWANRHSLLPEATMERLRSRYGSHDYRSANGVMRDVLVKAVNEQYADFLPRLKTPVILLWGAEDSEVPVAVAEKAAMAIPDARLQVVAGAGHLLPVTHPGELRQAVESFWR